jgi:hypothetical protein
MILKTIAGVALLYAVYCGLVFFLQRHVMFPRHMISVPTLKESSGMERFWLETAWGKVECWFTPGSLPGPAPAVIFAHGNGELIDHWPDELAGFSRMGIGVLLVEYPGYGRSTGSPSQERIGQAFEQAYDALVSRKDVDRSRVILFGRSIGAGAVSTLAARRPSAALILMSAFTSARSFAPSYGVPGFLIRDPFDNLDAVRRYQGPVLVIHGKEDEIIPYSHGLALSRAARRARMITYDCGHNDCPPDGAVFWQDLHFFLREAGILSAESLPAEPRIPILPF